MSDDQIWEDRRHGTHADRRGTLVLGPVSACYSRRPSWSGDSRLSEPEVGSSRVSFPLGPLPPLPDLPPSAAAAPGARTIPPAPPAWPSPARSRPRRHPTGSRRRKMPFGAGGRAGLYRFGRLPARCGSAVLPSRGLGPVRHGTARALRNAAEGDEVVVAERTDPLSYQVRSVESATQALPSQRFAREAGRPSIPPAVASRRQRAPRHVVVTAVPRARREQGACACR